jgi:hypothetical protein
VARGRREIGGLKMTDRDREVRNLIANWAEMLIKAISEDNTTDYKTVHRVLDAMKHYAETGE